MPDFTGDSEFSKLAAGLQDVDLVHLMLELAADVYPDLDRLGCLIEIDRLGVECAERQAPKTCDGDLRQRLLAISRVLYDVEGFHGNQESYYEPENSYLNDVLQRRCGIPISLGILYMSVAARAGVKMFGVNTPGHFVVGCRCEDEVLFVDPFTRGDVLSREDCKKRVEKVLGQKGVLGGEHFRPAPPQEIVARVLRNLKAAYATQNKWSAALLVQQRLVTLLPGLLDEQRDLGLILLRIGYPQKALTLLERYVSKCGAQQAATLEKSIRAARKMVAELN